MISNESILALIWPLRMEYMRGWQAALLLLALAIPIVLLGVRSLAGLGPVRRWVAVGARLLVLLLFVLIIAGARWQRENKILEVMVLRDISESTGLVHDYPGKSLASSVEDYLRGASHPKTLEVAGIMGDFHAARGEAARAEYYRQLQTAPASDSP